MAPGARPVRLVRGGSVAGCIAETSVVASNAAITAQGRGAKGWWANKTPGQQWTLVMETLECMLWASHQAGLEVV